MSQVVSTHHIALPMLDSPNGLGIEMTVCVKTDAGYYRVYRALGPDNSMKDPNHTQLVEFTRMHGNKVLAKQAVELFGQVIVERLDYSE